MPGDGATSHRRARGAWRSPTTRDLHLLTSRRRTPRSGCGASWPPTDPRLRRVRRGPDPGHLQTGPRVSYNTSRYPGPARATPRSARSRARRASRHDVQHRSRWWPRSRWPSDSPTSSVRSSGTTGSVASAACKGSCGEESPEPAWTSSFMADRTTSMSDANRSAHEDSDPRQPQDDDAVRSTTSRSARSTRVAPGTSVRHRSDDATTARTSYANNVKAGYVGRRSRSATTIKSTNAVTPTLNAGQRAGRGSQLPPQLRPVPGLRGTAATARTWPAGLQGRCPLPPRSRNRNNLSVRSRRAPGNGRRRS